jgi:hypothetical protein
MEKAQPILLIKLKITNKKNINIKRILNKIHIKCVV